MKVALLAVSCLLTALALPVQAVVVYSEDFDASDGGYVTGTVGSPAMGPWTHGPGGIGDSSAWRTGGGETGTPYEQLLTSPIIFLPYTGRVTLAFEHDFNFEAAWDGGLVMLGYAGASPFLQVPQSWFTQNGYTGRIQEDTDWGYPGDVNGLDVFTGSSNGFIESIVDLGTLTAGTAIQVRFRGGWDWYYTPHGSHWIVDNVQVSQIPEPATLSLLALGGLGVLLRRRRK